MQSPTRLTIFLSLLWATTLLYGEMLTFLLPLSCSSPPSDLLKIAVIADPKLIDSTTLGLAPNSLAKFYNDLYMTRSFHSSVSRLKPNAFVFLGDYFHGGALLSDQEWYESLRRFKRVFGVNGGERMKSDGLEYYVVGDSDIGFSSFHSHPEVISRYEKEFGPRNYLFSAGMLEFVVVDAQTLDGPEQGTHTSLSWEFIRNISKVNSSKPRVLLTHIPLYRPDETPCGPYRSSHVINQRVSYAGADHGISYQNYLSKETSSHLLDLIRPILVLSGHDHDQCTVTHSTPAGPIQEHTLGTISWQQGNLYPSYMLLTVTSSSNTTDLTNPVSTQLCFLPRQTHIYIWYLCQFVWTLLLLSFWPTNGFGCWDWVCQSTSVIRSIGRSLVVPSKDKDDEDCEYEMVWDAEGSMHLVKKPTVKVPNPKSDIVSTGRGNVTNRSTAKKNMVVEDPEVSVSLDTGKMSRISKSRTKRLIQRLFRICQLLIVIAGINVPIYMMLLFKDWIDR